MGQLELDITCSSFVASLAACRVNCQLSVRREREGPTQHEVSAVKDEKKARSRDKLESLDSTHNGDNYR
jgi:hypothetical protein